MPESMTTPSQFTLPALGPTFPTFSSLEALRACLAELGARAPHERRVLRAWLGKLNWDEAQESRRLKLPRRLGEALPRIREALQGIACIRSRHPGADPESERLLITLADRQTIESVLLPRQGVCVSTQMGCAVGCVFCMTGRGGLVRQLSDIEIAAQAAIARELRPDTKKVVFMGMGEPSHNLSNVFRAVEFLAEFGDFGHKDLVISSVGDERLFEKLFGSKVRPALALSLHSADDEKRRRLLPKGARMTVARIIERGEAWARLTGYPVQYEWTLMKGVNDSFDEIDRLAELLKGKYAMVNFIPVNAVEGSPWVRPERAHAVELVRRLRAQGVVATLRDSAAQDVDGGCGQLRARVLRGEEQ